MNARKVFLFRIIVHTGAWIPLAWLAWEAYAGNLGVNPIQAATQRTGKIALTLLVLSLACTPLNTFFNLRAAIKVRRALGLYAFLYAVIHVFIFTGLDYGFNWSFLKGELLEKPYIWVGLSTFTILAALAITSFDWWKKRLGKKWKLLHRLIYLAGILVIIHFSWAVKGDVLRLSGDIWQPLSYGFAVLLLLVARIPTVRRWAVRLRAISLQAKHRADRAVRVQVRN